MKHRWRFFWSSGLRWRGENYLLFVVLFHRGFTIRKPRWLLDYQAELDGR